MAEFTFDANNYLFVTSVGSGGGGTNVNIFDSAGNALTSTGGSLNVNVTSPIVASNPSVGLTGSIAPTSATEIGGVDSTGNLRAPTAAVLTNATALAVEIVDANGNQITTFGSATTNLTQVAGVTLGATAVTAYGTAPAAANVPGVNAFVTNTVATTLASTTITGTVAVTQSTSPWVDNLTQVAGVTLGATAVTAFGTAPAAVNVPGVNASLFSGVTGITATGSSLNVNVTNTVSGNPIAGNLTNNNAAPAANNLGVLPALVNAVSPLWTEGDQVLESVDLHGGQRIIGGNIPEITAAWTSATGANTALTLTPILGYSSVVVTLSGTSTITGGVVTFEVSDTAAGTNWYSINGLITTPGGALSVSEVLSLSATNTSITFSVGGWAAFRVRLSTVLTGTGTLTVGIQAGEFPAAPSAITVAAGQLIGVRSTNASATLADNQLNQNFFASNGGTNETLAVSDAVYGGAFSGTPNATLQGWSKMRASTVFRTVAATASGNTAIWTPGSGNKFRLLKLFIQVTDNASLAAGGVLTVDIQDGSTTTNITFSVFVPTTAVTTVIGDGAEIQVDLGAIGILSAAANNVLNVNLSSALATGVCRIIAQGTEE